MEEHLQFSNCYFLETSQIYITHLCNSISKPVLKVWYNSSGWWQYLQFSKLVLKVWYDLPLPQYFQSSTLKYDITHLVTVFPIIKTSTKNYDLTHLYNSIPRLSTKIMI